MILGIHVERARPQAQPGVRVLVVAFEAVHELVRGVRMLHRDAATLLVFEQRDRCAGLQVLPQEILAEAVVREIDPLGGVQTLRLDQHLQRLHHAFARVHVDPSCAGRPAATQLSYSRRLSGVAGKTSKMLRPRAIWISAKASYSTAASASSATSSTRWRGMTTTPSPSPTSTSSG